MRAEPPLRYRIRLKAVVGFGIGVLAVLLTSLVDALVVKSGLSGAAAWIGYAGISGLAFALSSVEGLRSRVSPPTDRLAFARRTLFGATLAFALFLSIILVIAPQMPLHWLLSYYAFSLVCDWLMWRLFAGSILKQESGHSFEALGSPHLPFILAGLFLATLTLAQPLAGRTVLAERAANWAYGFLAVAVVALLIRHAAWGRLRVLRGLPMGAGFTVLVIFLLVAAYYPVLTGPTAAEGTFLVDVYPSYLAGQLTNRDLMVSDTEQLRLGNIPDIGPRIDVRPDERGTALWDDLAQMLQGKQRVIWIHVSGHSGDTDQVLASFLKTNACLTQRYGGVLPTDIYELHPPFEKPEVSPKKTATSDLPLDPVDVNFGVIRLTGTLVERRVCSHDTIAVTLTWQVDRPTDSPVRVSLLLQDAKGRLISTQDYYVDDSVLRHTDQWAPGEHASGHYLLPVPFGTSPGDYDLLLAVFLEDHPIRLRIATRPSADLTAIGKVEVYRADDYATDPYETLQEENLLPARVELRDGLSLDAYGISTPSLIPGSKLLLTTRWRALVAPLPAYTIYARLESLQTIAEARGQSVDGSYPTDQWKTNESVIDRWELSIPRNAKAGSARLEIGVEGGKELNLGEINILPITHVLQAPTAGFPAQANFGAVAVLIGYDLPKTLLVSGQDLPLGLYWRTAIETQKNYTVFAQLIASDGRIIAQSDNIPASGARPTWSWSAGEYIADRHSLKFGQTVYQGEAKLVVGLYDTATLERVLLDDAKSDFYTLPTMVHVILP